ARRPDPPVVGPARDRGGGARGAPRGIRQRQVPAAESRRRPGARRSRHRRGGRPARRWTRRRCQRTAATRAPGLRVPGLPPPSPAGCPGQRDGPLAAPRHAVPGSQGAGGDAARLPRHVGARGLPACHAVGRRTATRGDRPRPGPSARAPARRRAHGQPRRGERAARARPARCRVSRARRGAPDGDALDPGRGFGLASPAARACRPAFRMKRPGSRSIDPAIGTTRLLAMLWMGHAARRPGRVLMSIAVVAVGVALGLGVNLVNHSALQEFQASLARINGEADASLRARIGTLDDRVWEQLARDPAVAAASPVIEFEAEVVVPAAADDAPVRLQVLAVDPLRAAQVTPALVPRAEAPIAVFDTDAVFLSPAASRALGVETGDTLTLRSGVHQQRLLVLGDLPDIGGGQRLAVVDLATAQWRFGWSGALDHIDLRLVHGADRRALEDRWATILPTALWSTPDLASSRMSNLSRAYRVNLTMLALIALMTGLFLVHANLALATRRQWPEFALLATLGAPRRTIAAAVLGQGFVVGAGGALLGCALGILLARIALATIGGDLGAGLLQATDVPLSVDPGTLAGFAALGIAAGVAGSAAPALRAQGIAPARALRGLPDSRAGGRRADLVALAAFVAGAVALALPPVAELPL